MPLNLPGKKSLFGGVIKDESGVPLSDWKAVVESGTLVTKQKQTTNSAQVVHTVTSGKKMYLVAASLAWVNTGTPSGRGCQLLIGSAVIAFLSQSLTDEDHESMAFAYGNPLILTSGQQIIVEGIDVNTQINAIVVGYEVNA